MLDKFEELIDKFMDVDDADMYKRFFTKTLRSEALYDLIDDQFRENNLYAISKTKLTVHPQKPGLSLPKTPKPQVKKLTNNNKLWSRSENATHNRELRSKCNSRRELS
jgi:hypothetical protein